MHALWIERARTSHCTDHCTETTQIGDRYSATEQRYQKIGQYQSVMG